MPGVSQIVFGSKNLDRAQVEGRRVIDVGACDFNGSIAPILHSWNPKEYIGVDIIDGPGVDVVCSADDLVEKFGEESFDIVVCFEMLEHTQDWRRSINNMKQICKPGGTLLVTTRSFGFPCHGYPHDYWRYETSDFQEIFSDFEILELESDPIDPGVFLKARKPEDYQVKDLESIQLLSVLVGERIGKFSQECYQHPYCRKLALKQWLKNTVHRLFLGAGRFVTRVLRLR